MKPFLIFGAGYGGKALLAKLGPEQVAAFVDNHPPFSGVCEGKPVLSFAELLTYKAQGKLTQPVLLSLINPDILEEVEDQLWRHDVPFLLAAHYLQQRRLPSLRERARQDREHRAEWDFMLQSGRTMMLPYPACQRYFQEADSVPGGFDVAVGLNYCLYHGHRIYMPERQGRKASQQCVAYLLSEQAAGSPHRYFHDAHFPQPEELFLDAGAAEGAIAAQVADSVRRIVLCECETKWHRPLQHTFQPWRDKTTLVNKQIGRSDTADTITLDTLLADETGPIFIKADIEGAEEDLLHGARKILRRGNVRLSICTYHDDNHPEAMQNFLRELGYHTSFSDNWVYLHGSFRRGMLYASKN